MSKPKYLRHRRTGVVFPYNSTLAKRNRNMEPYHGDGKPVFDEVDATGQLQPSDDPGELNDLELPERSGPADDGLEAGDGGDAQESPEQPDTPDDGGDAPVMIGDVALADATKDQLVEFAQKAFGVSLAKQAKVETLRTEVAKLLEQE